MQEIASRPLNVFLVDDSILIRNRLRELFSTLPSVDICGEADNAQQAISRIRDSAADVVILDINLHESSGLEVLTDIKSSAPSPLVIMLSVYSRRDVGEQYLKAGADHYFEKSGDFDQILNLLEEIGQRPTRHTDWLAESINQSTTTAPRAESDELPDSLTSNPGASFSSGEESLRIALDHNSDCVGILDAAGHLIWVNQRGQRLMKLESPILQQDLSWLELWSNQDAAAAHAAIKAVNNQHPKQISYFQRETAEGKQWWEVSLSLISKIVRASGKYMFIAREATARRAAEFALQQSENRYRNLFESAVYGIFQTAADGSGQVANAALATILGYDSANTLLVEWPNFHRESFADPIQRNKFFDLIFAPEGIAREFEYELKRKDGSRVWVSISARANRDEHGNYCGYKANISDITARRKHQQLIREQSDCLNRAHNAITITDLEGRVTFYNEGAARIYGYEAAEVLGRVTSKFMTDSEQLQMDEVRAQVLLQNEWQGELSISHKAGHKILIDAHFTLIRDEAGAPRARLCIASDITEKRELQNRALHGQRLEGLGMLAAGIAHDLNNVLSPIMIAAPMLAKHVTTSTASHLVEMVEKSALRSAGLVRQILSFAQTNGDEITLVEVDPVMADLSHIIAETFPKSITFKSSSVPSPCAIKGNAVHLHQVLLNLCVNARDALNNKGSINLSVENLTLTDKDAHHRFKGVGGDYVHFSVSDDGPGIPAEIIPKIWKPFFTTKDASNGTGLGLATVKEIVQKYDGFITLDTAVDQGTTFHIWFPATAPATKLEPTIAETTGAPPPDDLILVVDDEAAIRDLVETALSDQGYRVKIAEDGIEALDFITQNPGIVSLVISDLSMPGIGGLAMKRSIQNLAPQTRFLMMSGSPKEIAEITSDEGDDTQFMMKPFSFHDLTTKVNRLLPAHA